MLRNLGAVQRNVRSLHQRRRFISLSIRRYSTEGPQVEEYGLKKGDRVIVSMSGGVDSSVTARLLADEDYDLSAVFMRNWDTRDESGTDKGCEWEKDWEDVQLVCRQLGLPCELVDLTREYWIDVFQPSLRAWEAGETPNPDVWCNRKVKFGALMDRVVGLGGTWLATGHYAGIEWTRDLPPFSTTSVWGQIPRVRPKLIRSVDKTKDQTYYLSGVKESSFRKAIFPLRNIPKAEVRALAKKYGLPTAERSESMGICFVGERRKFEDFLAEYIPSQPGPILDLATRRKLGTHQGLWRYTIGQSAKIPGMPMKLFVAEKDIKNNRIFVVPGSRHAALYSSAIIVRDFHWIWNDAIPQGIYSRGGFPARVQFRHRMEDVPCTVKSQASRQRLEITFDEPQHAVASGQVAALYDEKSEWCLGSGEIVEGREAYPNASRELDSDNSSHSSCLY